MDKFTIDEFSLPAGEWVKLGLPVDVVEKQLECDGEEIVDADSEYLLKCELCFAVDVHVTHYRNRRDDLILEFTASVEGVELPELYNNMPFFDLVLERCEKDAADKY